MKIRLLLVDDHAVVRMGVRMLLDGEPDFDIVGEADSASEAINRIAQLNPEVVLMDIHLPDLSGIEATREIKRIYPETAVIALTIHESEEYFFKMLEAGASGYVPKRAAPEELITAIRAAARGDVYIYPSLAKLLVKDYLGQQQPTRTQNSLDGLTSREQEVLTLLADGASNNEIAEALSISPKTVARHRENIMGKLNLHSRTELVKYAIRKGIIEP
ncbi:MAG: response regulator transcription factor [Anaerolineales bacterium]|nr:response regulator transcription factor [Anaerolineales bacterium]MCK4976491.1 response regulator transcription factor [Anaerolineales bacterium]